MGKRILSLGGIIRFGRNKPDAYVAANKRWEPLLDHLRAEGKQFFFQGYPFICSGWLRCEESCG